jgi:hypothetical protein
LWLFVICTSGVVADNAAAATQASAADSDTEPAARISWLDQRYNQISDQTDKLATWVDGFFTQTRSVEDTAATLIRIRPQYEWSDQDGSDWKLRATGRLILPALSKRLSLVFIGGNDDFENEFYDPGLAEDGSSTVGLEYRVRDEERSTLDLTAGLKSGPKGKLGTRYRFQVPFMSNNRFRFSEELYWIGGDGFGTLTRVDLDHRLNSDTLIRLANKARYSEESNGVEWSSRLAWIRRLNEKSALQAFTYITGETDPRYLKTRGVGMGYRRKLWRRWLFWELEPNYQWRKPDAGDNREGVFSIDLRLELVLGERELNNS